MDQATLERLSDIPFPVEALLPGPALRLSELLALADGSVIRTLRPAGETVEIRAGGALLGFAELAGDADGRAVRMIRFQAESR